MVKRILWTVLVASGLTLAFHLVLNGFDRYEIWMLPGETLIFSMSAGVSWVVFFEPPREDNIYYG